MRVEALFVHPIKSCSGIAVERAQVTPRGLANDRRWMVVDEAGRFLTQRVLPRMALVRLSLHEQGLRVGFDESESLPLPFLFSNGRSVEIEVWKHRGVAVRHEAGSDWFTRVLARPVQLVCMPDGLVRPVESRGARAGDQVSFADAYPLLVTNSASLEDLNLRSNFRSDVRRFRPNVVVSGAPAWVEDDWRLLRVGSVPLRLATACARCSIPGLDPDSGVATQEPLRTLATFRKRDHEIYFGVNAIPDGVGELRVGDSVDVIDSLDRPPSDTSPSSY
jgi:uncharacterized protein YcbX